MATDIFPPLQRAISSNPQGIIDAAFILRPELVPDNIDKHEVAPYSYSPYITTALYIEFSKSPAIKLLVGRVPNKQEPVLIDNYGTIYEFQVTKERSELGKFYKILKLGKNLKKSLKDHVSIGLEDYLSEEELTIFYIPSQTDKDGDTIEECLTIFNANNVQGNFRYSYLLGKKHELIKEVLRLITLKSINGPIQQSQNIKDKPINNEEDDSVSRLVKEKEKLEKEVGGIKMQTEQRIEKLREQNEQLKEQLKITQAQKGKEEIELIESQNRQVQLDKIVKTKDEQLAEIIRLNETYKTKVTELVNNLKSIQSKSTNKDLEFIKLQSENKESKTKFVEAINQIAQIEEHLQIIAGHINRTVDKSKIPDNKIMSVNSMIGMKKDIKVNKLLSEIEMKYGLLNEEFDNTKNDLNKQLLEFKSKFEEMKKEKISLSLENKDGIKMIAQLKSSLSNSNDSINLIKENFDSIQKDKSEIIFELKDSKKIIKQLEDNNTNLNSQLQEIKFTRELKEQQINLLTKEKESISNKLEKLKEKLTQNQEYNGKLHVEIQQLNLEKQILTQEKQRLKDLINDSDQRKVESISEKDEDLRSLAEKIRDINLEKDRLLSEMKYKDKEIFSLKESLTQKSHEVNLLSHDKESMSINVSDKKDEVKTIQQKLSQRESVLAQIKEEREKLQIALTSKEKELEIKEKKWEEEEKRWKDEKTIANNQFSTEQTNAQRLLNELNDAKLQLKKQETENSLQINKLQGDIKRLLVVKNQLKQLEQKFMAMSSQSIGQMSSILNNLSDTTLQTEEHDINQSVSQDINREREIRKDESKKMENMLSDIKFNLLKRIGTVS